MYDSDVNGSGGCEHASVCPLNQAKVGALVRVKRLCASPENSQRLREIGFCEDQVVRLLSRQTNVVCIVCNTRLGLAAQLAESIMVEPLACAA